ncbi:hypothetical protein H5410_001178 [Solanum commersonii]|uniref:Uncharacterized protein n=1 Tax=Solanum commersonii TaxID=4109 RepID=A0A9J6AXY0_SOLCO|nr:hypothetical protein H5410_001178 [Solanum commersonii]
MIVEDQIQIGSGACTMVAFWNQRLQYILSEAPINRNHFDMTTPTLFGLDALLPCKITHRSTINGGFLHASCNGAKMKRKMFDICARRPIGLTYASI